MATLDVSVIMAAYNGERFIEESIRSVLAQTHSPLELIVVDDGSTDGTWELVNELKRADPRIVYCFQPNGRQGRARNNGILRARGELIAFCDQDDLWLENKLALQVAALAAADRVDVLFSDGFLFYDDDIADERTTFKTLSGVWDGPDMFRLMFKENRIPVLSSLVRRDAILRVGLINEDPAVQNCDDWDLWLRLAESGSRFLGMPERLVRYRQHAQQASRDPNEMLKGDISVLEQFRASPLLDAAEAEQDLCRRYERLIDGLVRAGKPDQASAWARKWLRTRKRFGPFWRAVVCEFFPGGFNALRIAETQVSSLLKPAAP